MTQLIKLTENNGQTVVSARDLYDFLKPQTKFPDWITRCLSYSFIKDVDYQAVLKFEKHSNGVGGTNTKDYALTLDCAKEIAMIQRTEKGKEARQYFIQCEKRLEALKIAALKKVQPSDDEIILQSQQILIKRVEAIKMQLVYANDTIAQQAPIVKYAETVLDSETGIPITIIAKELGMSAIMLNRKLEQMDIQYKVKGTWVLKAKYQDKGYDINQDVPYLDKNNKMQSKINMNWSEAGRMFIHQKLNPKLISA